MCRHGANESRKSFGSEYGPMHRKVTYALHLTLVFELSIRASPFPSFAEITSRKAFWSAVALDFRDPSQLEETNIRDDMSLYALIAFSTLSLRRPSKIAMILPESKGRFRSLKNMSMVRCRLTLLYQSRLSRQKHHKAEEQSQALVSPSGVP